jgi:hypothetical protein
VAVFFTRHHALLTINLMFAVIGNVLAGLAALSLFTATVRLSR